MASSRADLLAEINAHLPPGVDWKQGAITYLRQMVVDGGEQAEWYHLVKPFVGGPDFEPLWVELFPFWDVVHKVDLPMRSRVLDVGCGPGWTVHWLAKLGHHVIGLDISEELLAIADRRMQSDPHPPFQGLPFSYELTAHDIESQPLHLDEPVQLALFESTLHHFYDPVAVLQNVAADLATDGVLAVIEAAAPDPDTQWHRDNVALMEQYHTIERPYTRRQILDMLELAGYEYAQFFRPLHGLHGQDADSLNALTAEVATEENLNIFIASPRREGLARLVPDPVRLREWRGQMRYVEGFFDQERRTDGSTFRWSGTRSSVHFTDPGDHALSVATVGLAPDQQQHVYAVLEGSVIAEAVLGADQPEALLEVSVPGDVVVALQSDRAFSPAWTGQDDGRVLSFTLDASTVAVTERVEERVSPVAPVGDPEAARPGGLMAMLRQKLP